ncbi:metallophosphoesterase family protein [Haloferula sargassicola]|uniref:Calcineurin-like phosphoesterase domain-containing protein n=1 Tax=Haloferula sargassicola TaxID=490096 RepID=A0ABP9UPM4_9BACT
MKDWRKWMLAAAVMPGGWLAAEVHGPLVQWSGDPRHEASVRWLETAAVEGTEGIWQAGPSGFGYGDDDDRTVLRGMEGRYQEIAIRREFTVPETLPENTSLDLMARYDDAFVLWVDGREKAIRNARVVDGKWQVIEKHEASGWERISIGSLAPGKHVIAALGINDGLGSSDFTLDLRLAVPEGDQHWYLIPDAASWEYLAGETPEIGWKTRVSGETAAPEPEQPAFSWRIEGEDAWWDQQVSRATFADTSHQVAHVDLAELPAGKVVEIRIGDASWKFRTAPEKVDHLCFVTGGDVYHEREPMDRMNRRAGGEDPDFVMLGGDLAYTNDQNPGRWAEFIDSWVENVRAPDGRLVPLVVAIGNHEVVGNGYRPVDAPGPDHAREFFSLFKMPQTGSARQAIDFGDEMSLVLLDSGHVEAVAAQTGWLEKTLEARREIPRLFVCYHRPAWGCGTKEDSKEIQAEWCPLIEKFQVDAVFENDHHVFSMTHPLRGGKVDEKAGVPYLGAGAWSVHPRTVPEDALKKRPWLIAAQGVNHFYRVELGPFGWKAIAKDIDGKELETMERRWRR